MAQTSALRVGLLTGLALVGAAFAGAPVCAQGYGSGVGQAPGQGFGQASPPSIAAVVAGLRGDQIALVRRTLADAASHGLDPAAYLPDSLDAALDARDRATRAAAADALASALMTYAHDVHAGRLPTADFMSDWGLRPAPYDPRGAFLAAVQQDRLQDWLAGLSPPYAGYENLRQGLQTYRGIAADGGWRVLAEGSVLKPGADSPRVVALRARLAAEDPAVRPGPSTVYDDALVQAVMRAQKRFGLRPDGVLAASTLKALNVPVQQRVDQIVANLERWRWLPAVLPADRIQVNIAAAVLTVFHEDTPTLSMRAVTGRPGDETPMLHSQVQSIVFNPPWNVPSSIATKELWPKERANPGYFAKHSIAVIPLPGGGTRLQQKAGDASALGRVKFDFPNTYGVYLHDTPSRSAFGGYGRMVSHGCVRLEKPMDLAKAVLAADPRWQDDAVEQAIAAGDTLRAPLPQPIAVFLLYWTAYLAPDGAVNFRDDPYAWDRELVRRLGPSPAAAPRAAVAAL